MGEGEMIAKEFCDTWELSNEFKEIYTKEGFIVLKGAISAKVIEKALEEIEVLIRSQYLAFSGMKASADLSLNELIHLSFVKGSKMREVLYGTLRHIPSLRYIATHPRIEATLKSLGFELPGSFELPTLRVDIPSESEFLTRAHQDLRSICTERCATIWFPLKRVDKRLGTIKVYPGTHRLGILDHCTEQGQLKVSDMGSVGNPIFLEADPGDLIIMDSFCIHESSQGETDQIKLNGQIFWNDLSNINVEDDFYKLRNLPDAKDLIKSNEED